MDKKFHDDLDSLYNVEQDTWDDWHDGDIK
jgi:hypothetical protein